MSFEKEITIIPLVVAALAVTFDVGYFWAVDINFFTLFSLSEHLLFAAEAIPIVVFVSFCGALTIAVSSAILAGDRGLSAGGNHKASRVRWLSVFWYIYMVVIIVSLYWYKQYAFSIFNIVILAIGIAFECAPLSFVVHLKKYGRAGVTFATAVAVFSLVLASGYGTADAYLRGYKDPRHLVELKNMSEISARVIRSGDRGILLIDTKGKVQFIKFDYVVSIAKL